MNYVNSERAWAPSPVAPVDAVPQEQHPGTAARVSAPGEVPTNPAASGLGGLLHETSPVVSSASEAGPSGLSALLAQARAAQMQLAGQPLPIANHRLPLIQKLFGG